MPKSLDAAVVAEFTGTDHHYRQPFGLLYATSVALHPARTQPEHAGDCRFRAVIRV